MKMSFTHADNPAACCIFPAFKNDRQAFSKVNYVFAQKLTRNSLQHIYLPGGVESDGVESDGVESDGVESDGVESDGCLSTIKLREMVNAEGEVLSSMVTNP